MAQENTPQSNLVSAPIVPTFPEIQTSVDPLALLKAPSPVIAPTITFPPVPNGVPPAININEQLQGDFKTGPNPGKHPVNQPNGTGDYIKAIKGYMNDDAAVKDRHKYGRTYSYGSGYKDANFERYYTHPKFKELGFSPWRDNDTHYNERSSWSDDFSRMSGQWLGLAWSGFKSIWGDEHTANEEMEKGMAIGSSTQKGFGASFTNFTLNSAYTVGVMSEIVLEDLGLAAIEVFSFGTASPEVAAVGAVRNSMAFGRLAKAWKGTYNFMKGLKNAENVREFYSWAKAGENLKDFGKFINPAQRSMTFMHDVATGSKGMEHLGDMAKVTKGFGQFYRDFRELNVAHSEAKLEGEGASSKYQQQLLDQFYAENGVMPEGKAADDIYERGQSIKATVTLANDLTIYATNKLVFEDLFEGFRPGSKIADAFLEGSGRFMKKAEAKTFKVGQNIVDAGTKTGWKKTADFLTKSAYVPWSKKYFVGNLGEALQENSQEAIQVAALDYYDKIHRDPTQVGFYSALGSIGKGTSSQFSGQGLETFLSGFLMGSLIQGPSHLAMNYIPGAIKGTNKQAKTQAQETDNDIMAAANHVGRNALLYGDHNVDMASAMNNANKERKKAAAQGDEKTSHDMSDELQIQYFNKLSSSGNMGLVTDHVDDMLTLSDDELAQAYELEASQAPDIRKKLSTLKERAEGYERKFKYAKAKMPNPADPWMFSAKNKDGSLKNPEAYEAEMDKYLAHERAVGAMLFATEAHERIAGRMASIGKNLAGQGWKFRNLVNVIKGGTPVANAAASDVSLLIDDQEMVAMSKSLDDQIAVLNLGTPEQKKEAANLVKQREHMAEWISSVHQYKLELASDAKAMSSPEEAAARKQSARVRPGATVRDKKGNEYVVDSVKHGKAIVKVGGNKYKQINRRSLEVIKDAKSEKPLEFEHEEGDDLTFAISNMYDAYNSYLRHVASMKKGYVFDDQLNEAFKEIKDYYALEHDAHGMVNTINALSNPDHFKQYTEIEKRIQRIQREQKMAKVGEALEEFKRLKADNKFLNALFDLGVFVLPEDVEALKNFEVVDFYDVAKKELVPYNSETYKKILDLVDEYAEEAGKRTTGKATPEAGKDAQARERNKYNAQARKKLANDKRTYADHAKQYGFDPNSPKSSVPTEKVLRGIVSSKFATAAEKALAKRLLTIIKSGSVITFVNNHPNPGSYSKATGSVVDARYSSQDYASGATGHPIEHVILHEYLHELTVEALATDPIFKASIEKLLVAAKAYLASPAGKAAYGEKPLYGTMNEAEFVAEMNNPVFQSMLQKIPYTVTGKVSNLWEEFTDTVRKFFSRLLKVNDTNTALDEAMYIITSKLDNIEAQPSPQAVKKASGNVLGSTDVVTGETPIALLETTPEGKALVKDLIKAFHAYREEQELPPMLTPDEQTVTSPNFLTFMQESGTAGTIIEAFNEGRKPKGPIKVTPTKKVVPNIWAVGNKKTFTGEVGGVMLTEVPIEVTEYSEYVDSDTKEQVKEVVARNLNTGELIQFDLNSEDAIQFKYPELVGTTKTPDVISEAAYQEFVDKGTVDMAILETIAQKIKTNTPLSPYETAIFGDNTQTRKINDIIVATSTTEERLHKGVPVIEDLKIVNKSGQPGAAQYDKTNKVIRINPVLLRQKYDQKAWVTSRKQPEDSSYSTPLAPDTFSSYEEFEAFVIEHEYQHTLLDFGQFKAANDGRKVTWGEYEDYINDRALVETGLVLTEAEPTEDIMEMYSNITNKTELDAWKEAALDIIGSSHFRNKVTEQIGTDFNGDYVKKLLEDKEKGLAMSLNFEALTPGKVVLMKNGKLMVVKETTAKDVILVTPDVFKTGDPTGGKTIIAKGAIASQIKMIHSDFIDKAEQEVAPTPDEVVESNEVLKNASTDESEEIKEDAEKAKTLTPEEAEQKLLEEINKCNKK